MNGVNPNSVQPKMTPFIKGVNATATDAGEFRTAIGAAAASHNHAWADITSGTPTTLAGYGITDAATFAQGAKADSATQPDDLGELALLDANELTLVESPPIFLSPQDADAAGGTNVVDFVIPFAFSLTSVEFRCRESDPPTGSAAQLDVLLAGTTIFSTNPTIDANEFSSTTAAVPPVLTSNPTALTSGQRLQFDLDQVGAANEGRGYYAILRGTRTNA